VALVSLIVDIAMSLNSTGVGEAEWQGCDGEVVRSVLVSDGVDGRPMETRGIVEGVAVVERLGKSTRELTAEEEAASGDREGRDKPRVGAEAAERVRTGTGSDG
jgi:hypothetical protein